MTVVSNTSPITSLAAISQLDLLRQLYGNILIPEAVVQELTGGEQAVPGGAEVQTLEWIQTRQLINRSRITELRQELDEGESEAIALALELNATRLLIDERRGRIIATNLKIKIDETTTVYVVIFMLAF